jgi:hypothetical protein
MKKETDYRGQIFCTTLLKKGLFLLLFKKNINALTMQNEDDYTIRLKSKIVDFLEKDNIDVVVYEEIPWHMERGAMMNLRFCKKDIDLYIEIILKTQFGQTKPITVHLVFKEDPPLHVNVLIWYSFQKIE